MTQSSRPAPLIPLNESWQRALAVVAHPDDLEFGAASAVARWTRQGKAVVYCLVTSGEAGIDSMEPERAREVREAEQRASAVVVGVRDVDFLGLPDGTLEYGVALRRAIAREVRRHRPEVVITNNFRATWDGATAWNQPDHIATGQATFDAVRDAGNRWVFAEHADVGLQPWGGVKQVWAFGSPESGHGVDVTDTFEVGIESLEAHKAYLDGLGPGAFDVQEFLEAFARGAGSRMGVRFGVSFEVLPLGEF